MTAACFDNTSRDPVNKLAAMLHARGVKLEIIGKIYRPIFDSCPVIWGDIKKVIGLQADLTGRKFGRMTIVGLSKERFKTGPKWVAKCACGLFEFRNAKAVKNPKNDWDCCEICRKTIQGNYCTTTRNNRPSSRKQ